MNNIWTDEEIKFLYDNYLYMTDKQIAQILGRGASGVKTKRQKLGFEKDKAHRKYTFTDVVSEFEKTDYILLSDENDYYDAAQNTLKYMCPRHLDKGVMTISLGHLQSGRGCKYCGRESAVQLRTKSDEQTNIECMEICNNKKFEYKGYHRENGIVYIKYICPNHKEIGIQYMRKGNMSRENIIACPYCVESKKYKFSKGEQVIKNFLDIHDMYHIRQFSFDECKDERDLPFDFYLPNYNVCIEFDGQHHFKPVTFNGISKEQAIINHENTKKHDEIKNQYCKDHNIKLIRIPYYDFKSIEQILSDLLLIERKIA